MNVKFLFATLISLTTSTSFSTELSVGTNIPIVSSSDAHAWRSATKPKVQDLERILGEKTTFFPEQNAIVLKNKIRLAQYPWILVPHDIAAYAIKYGYTPIFYSDFDNNTKKPRAFAMARFDIETETMVVAINRQQKQTYHLVQDDYFTSNSKIPAPTPNVNSSVLSNPNVPLSSTKPLKKEFP